MLRRSILHGASFMAVLAGLCATATAAGCEQKTARLVSLQGGLDIQEGRPEEWKAVTPEREFCPGDRIRTRSQSRATLELNNKTYISLNQQTTIVFSGIKARNPSWLDLLKGIIYVRSRTPSSLDVRTRYVNAAIKGTEFLVSADDSQGQVIVFEGTVESSNSQGRIILTDGQAAVAKAGEAPVRKLLVSPRDAVQWALYYPPVLDLRQQAAHPAIQQATERYLQGDSLGALAALDAAGNPDAILRAGLLIGLGRAEEALPPLDSVAGSDPRFGEALALRSVIALARNDKAMALDLAQQSTNRQPQSPAAWTALSYAWQADFKLDRALEAAEQAARLDAGNALAHVREAELLASLGRRHEAKEAAVAAAQINPRLSRVWAVQGYAQLNDMDYEEAAASFRKAVELDNADPLARFGLGLSKIRAGDLEAGTADLELAANLDPDDAITRSYLGKAYYEQKNAKVAATELDTAKQLDPKDPTPWFYDAIKKQTENRPVEALQDLQKAITLNGNRAVYRSKQLLDDDLAARSSALGRLYNTLGFGQRAVLEGWKSVNDDPDDYSSHRFLADTYQNLPRFEAARASELLQSQLLQPLSLTPVQPSLVEQNLLVLSGSGPSQSSFNEFNPLFQRDRFALQVSGIAGNLNSLGDEVVQSGIIDKFSYSVGQYHYQTDGYRPDNDLKQDIYNAFFQVAATSDLSLFAEFRHKEQQHGDLSQGVFDIYGPGLPYNPGYRNDLVSERYRFGLKYKLDESSTIIGSGVFDDDQNRYDYSPNNSNSHDTNAEGQYRHQGGLLDLIVGGGYYKAKVNYLYPEYYTNDSFRRPNGYVYSTLKLPYSLSLTLGSGFSGFSNTVSAATNRFYLSPKIGLMWDITPSTTFRIAALRNQNWAYNDYMTIEPTQVAGFNQFYFDPVGTQFWRYGTGLDVKVSEDIFVGGEASLRNIKTQLFGGFNDPLDSWHEQSYRGYANFTLTPAWALAFNYRYDTFKTDYGQQVATQYNTAIVPNTNTHTASVSLRYFHPSGLFANMDPLLVSQAVTGYNLYSTEANGIETRTDTFLLLDAAVGFRLPKRYGVVKFQVRNLFDTHFNYQNEYWRTNNYETAPAFSPTRTFLGQITLAF